MRILGIETSCDESSVAFLEIEKGKILRLEQLVATQEIHAKYGGVVPEVAAREHAVTLPPLLAALADKIVRKPDGRLLAKKIDAIAVTSGPGLVTSLRVGLDTARALALAWKKKIIGINHIEGHIYSNWLSGEGDFMKRVEFPALVLVVSGGHTELLAMRGHGKYRLLGSTRDDAAGEAFDKSAKLMGLGYPGGPAISRLAKEGMPAEFNFPRPMIHEANYDFSFAGLKTAVRYFIEKNQNRLSDGAFVKNVAASLEQAIVDVLVTKALRAARDTRAKTILLAGGVAANAKLRATLARETAAQLPGVRFVEPALRYCTDNAAMIAAAGQMRASLKKFAKPEKLEADPQWELGRITL